MQNFTWYYWMKLPLPYSRRFFRDGFIRSIGHKNSKSIFDNFAINAIID